MPPVDKTQKPATTAPGTTAQASAASAGQAPPVPPAVPTVPDPAHRPPQSQARTAADIAAAQAAEGTGTMPAARPARTFTPEERDEILRRAEITNPDTIAALSDDDLEDLADAQARDDARDAAESAPTARIVRESTGNMGGAALGLLVEACDKYGVNPLKDRRPQELLAWRYYETNEPNIPDYVVIVTAGGVKIRYYDDPTFPMDQDTQDRIRRALGLFRMDPVTKLPVPLPMPADTALPRSAVTGEVANADHQYQGGYLRAGGKAAADEKESRRAARAAKLGL